MPGKEHVAGATPKQNRQYEHIKESERKAGRSPKVAKRIAAATVNKQKSKKKR
jgi:hypothetical protein